MSNEELMARVRAVRDDAYLCAAYLAGEHVGDLMGDVLDALKEELKDNNVGEVSNVFD